MTGVLIRRMWGETETQGRRCVKTEAEMGARHPQASQQLGEQREEGRIFP